MPLPTRVPTGVQALRGRTEALLQVGGQPGLLFVSVAPPKPFSRVIEDELQVTITAF
jgi:hypothetical protein